MMMPKHYLLYFESAHHFVEIVEHFAVVKDPYYAKPPPGLMRRPMEDSMWCLTATQGANRR